MPSHIVVLVHDFPETEVGDGIKLSCQGIDMCDIMLGSIWMAGNYSNSHISAELS